MNVVDHAGMQAEIAVVEQVGEHGRLHLPMPIWIVSPSRISVAAVAPTLASVPLAAAGRA